MGIGTVTLGWCVPARSVNCMLKLVTTTPAVPLGLTTTVNGTMNGDTVGQNGLATGCAMMLSDSALIDTVEDEDDDPATPNVVGVVGRLESPHEAAMSAAPNRSARAM